MRTHTALILLAGLGLSPTYAAAQTLPLDRAFPSDPSTADDIIVGVQLRCLATAEQPPEIQTTGENSYTLTYEHPSDSVIVCPSPVPPETAFPTNIGKLPAGLHHVHFIGKMGGETIYETDVSFIVSDIAGTSVSGAWYAPQQSGRGMFLIRTTVDLSPPEIGTHPPPEQLYVVYWATHDAEGNPTWALTSGLMSDNVVGGDAIYTTGTPLAPGEADLEQQPWGTLSFEYLGCDKGRLIWDANDEAITDGSVDMIKLTSPDGLDDCSMPNAIDAVWLD
ncbi:MAG: hypothetical protein R3F22_01175 [Lysobacteraceae bacterium]